MTAEGKLNFQFISCSKILSAIIPNGYYRIACYHNNCIWELTLESNEEYYHLGKYKTIYEVLDAANGDYAKRMTGVSPVV